MICLRNGDGTPMVTTGRSEFYKFYFQTGQKFINRVRNYRFLGKPVDLISDFYAKTMGHSDGELELCLPYNELVARITLYFNDPDG